MDRCHVAVKALLKACKLYLHKTLELMECYKSRLLSRKISRFTTKRSVTCTPVHATSSSSAAHHVILWDLDNQQVKQSALPSLVDSLKKLAQTISFVPGVSIEDNSAIVVWGNASSCQSLGAAWKEEAVGCGVDVRWVKDTDESLLSFGIKWLRSIERRSREHTMVIISADQDFMPLQVLATSKGVQNVRLVSLKGLLQEDEEDSVSAGIKELTLDPKYSYNRPRVVELAQLILQNLENKPDYVISKKIYECISNVNRDYLTQYSDNPQHLPLDFKALLAVCSAALGSATGNR